MTATDAESRDLAYSNIIQTCLMRTMEGFVPNFASGPHVSFDRTEPQVGARVVLEVFKKWGDAWLVDVVFDALASWNDWVWSHRRGEGVYAGPDGHADLIVLGSDPNASPGGVDGGENTMQAARYESGLDNSPQYDGPDKDSQGSGPVTFDNTTHHMQLYDVGMTALFLSDTEALIALARATGRGAAVPALQARFDAVAAALNAHLWDDAAGMYTNKLFNGSFYARYSPTSFFPLISGAAPPDRAAAMMRLAAAPEGFCLNTSHTPDADALMLVDWWDGKHDNWAAATTQSNVDAVNSGAYNFIRVEASVLGPAAGPGAGRVPLFSWYSSAADDYALTNSSTPPAAGYALVRPEGYCFAGAPPGGGWPTTPLTLWYSAARRDYQTCGTAKCESDATAAKYDPRGTMCTAWDATLPFNAPCKFGCNSIARGDAAWQDGTFNNYWRGRIWGPHVQLVYWGLARPEYAAVPGVAAARAALLAQGRALLSQEWINLRQITENYNGLVGYGEDVGNADPAYTWGALPGFITLLEQGIF